MSMRLGKAAVAAIIVTKQTSGSPKINPLKAAFNAIALMATNPWSTRPGLFII
jgi:phage terminase large subunit-like protein